MRAIKGEVNHNTWTVRSKEAIGEPVRPLSEEIHLRNSDALMLQRLVRLRRSQDRSTQDVYTTIPSLRND